MRLIKSQDNIKKMKDIYPHLFLGEKNDKPSLTIPEQTLSLKQLIERHTRGQYVPQFDGQYDNEETENLPDFSRMSTIERAEYMHDLKLGIQEHQEIMRENAIHHAQEQKKHKEVEENKEKEKAQQNEEKEPS